MVRNDGEPLSTDWSAITLLPWGKTDPANTSWMPLVRHLEDSSDIGAVLYERWLSPHQRAVVSSSFGSDSSARALATFLCGVHDIGKCAPAFAFKAKHPMGPTGDRPFLFLYDRLRDAGFSIPPAAEVSPTPHGVLGQRIVADFLRPLAPGAARNVHRYAGVVGGHHGRNPQLREVSEIPPSHLGTGLWELARREIWDGIVRRSRAEAHLKAWVTVPLPVTAQMILSGLVIVADWMASNVELFPYDEPSADRLDRALDLINLPPDWAPHDTGDAADQRLGARFPALRGRTAQPIQSAVLDACRAMTEPSMLIVEAPMGCGKTEAALMGAEILAERFGLGGTFIGLPTMATTNPMFTRVRSWLERTTTGTTTLNLVHSKAGLNEEFAELVRLSHVAGISDDEPGSRSGAPSVTVATWFWGRKRSALASHVVGTIDQALFAGLKAKHVVLRHLAINGKVVVIDEVHAADDYMRVYLKRVLTWLGAYGTPVILMSATLPPEQRQDLAAAYASGRVGRTVQFADSGGSDYPRLTEVGRELTDRPVGGLTPGRTVRLVPHCHEMEAITETLTELLTDGGCAGIICNTVRRAQEVYEHLSATFGDDVRLLHSKFAAPHRARLERQLVTDLGPGSPTRPARLLVVGTQVLEQSLDICFDVMVSDLAPMDLLMQRIGRLHRHPRGDGESERPVRLRSAQCLVTGVTDLDGVPPLVEKGSVAVYGASPLLRTRAVLGDDACDIALPPDIPRLVAAAYDPTLPCPGGWEDAWDQAERRAAAKRLDQEHRAEAFLLTTPIKDAGLAGLIEHAAADPDDERTRAAAQVRDAEESLEVIVITRDNDGQCRVLEDVGDHSGQVIPLQFSDGDHRLAKALASCTVSLPGALTRGFRRFDETLSALENTIDTSGWQQSPWLAGQLFLVLDRDGNACLGEHRLAYDTRLGLRLLEEEA